HNQFVGLRIICSKLTASRLLRSIPRHPWNLEGTKQLRCCRENDRISRGGGSLLRPRVAPLSPSDRAVRPWQSDITNRGRYLQALHEYEASMPGSGNVPPAQPGVIPELCAARKARLGISAANRAPYSSRRCAEQNKVRERSSRKP